MSNENTIRYFRIAFWSVLAFLIGNMCLIIGGTILFYAEDDMGKLFTVIGAMIDIATYIPWLIIQILLLQNPNYSRPEPEWQRLRKEFGSITMFNCCILICLMIPLGPIIFFWWYWMVTRVCLVIATACRSTSLLPHARKAKFNSILILINLSLLPLIAATAGGEWLSALLCLLFISSTFFMIDFLMLINMTLKALRGRTS